MDKEQQERLEQELRFLKESLEADVISKDEYERGIERIERKLKELKEPEEERPLTEEGAQEEPEKAEIGEEPEETEREEPVYKEEKSEEEQPEIEIKEIKEKPTKIIGAEEEPEEVEKEEFEEKGEEEETEEEPAHEEKPEEKETEGEINLSKKWLYGLAILIIAILLFFSVRGCKNLTGGKIIEFIPECSSDSNCKQEGMAGVCSSPGTKESKCEFKEDTRTNLIVINHKDCKLCDSSDTKTIIKEIFPNVKIEELDYSTPEAKTLVNQLGIDALPAYIFDSNISSAMNFDNFKTALIKKGNHYLISNTASGAVYYFKRPLIKNKLDLYLLPETTGKIEANMQEVLDLFNGRLNFTKHAVTEKQKGMLEEELAINTYPTFMFNNQVKFRGFLPANAIKEKICKVTYFDECSKELSKT